MDKFENKILNLKPKWTKFDSKINGLNLIPKWTKFETKMD